VLVCVRVCARLRYMSACVRMRVVGWGKERGGASEVPRAYGKGEADATDHTQQKKVQGFGRERLQQKM